jgi:hypothetical protein
MNYNAFVYKWKNSIGKQYIGYHLGNTDDGYISSSRSEEFWNDWNDVSIKWKRDIIAIGTREQMVKLERTLLKENKDEIYNGTTFYNNSIGGGVVFTNEVRKKISSKNKGKVSPNKGNTSPKVCCILCHSEVSVYQLCQHYESKTCQKKRNGPTERKIDYTCNVYRKKISDSLKGKTKSLATRQKMSDASRKKRHTQETKDLIRQKSLGKNNSNYETIWVTNGKENRRIKQVESIPEGWYTGRVM